MSCPRQIRLWRKKSRRDPFGYEGKGPWKTKRKGNRMINFSSADWADVITYTLAGMLLVLLPRLGRKIKRARAKFRLNLKKRRKEMKKEEKK